MRMTNKIMQNNSLYNINQTKIAEDKFTTQMTSQSKIDRPSDDPVVAIRALRLRTNVTEVTQYYEKNAPDANQWLDVTAGALTTVTDILTNLYKQAEKGFNKELKSDDLKVILDQMKAYTHEFYATGNQDYAGRYIFSGYRTDMELTFKEDTEKSYEITEKFSLKDFDVLNKTDHAAIDSSTGLESATEQDITNSDQHRLRLSYKDIYIVPEPGAESMEMYLTDKNGSTSVIKGFTVEESGEVFFSDSLYEELEAKLLDGGELQVVYRKDTWQESDLRPEHYFKCRDVAEDITYNADFDVNKAINYDVGYNQKIQVNTNACEVFNHDLYRDMDDLSRAIDELAEIEKMKEEYSKKLDEEVEGSDEYAKVEQQLSAITKAYNYTRENVKNLFSGQITKYQNYMDDTNLAITKNGTRSSRLEMISSRLMDQQATYKELQEENEGIDMTETAVKLASAKLTYDAALQATSKILQNSLMNYI